MSIWATHQIPPNTFRRFQVGTLQLLIYNHGQEWRIHSCSEDSSMSQLPESGSADLLDLKSPWHRFGRSTENPNHDLILRPAFPDKALIARPATGLQLAPEGSALFYLAVPPVIEICSSLASGKTNTLTNIPVTPLAKTWHGNKSAGQECYSLRSPARRSADHPDHKPEDILVAIDLVNQLETSFLFERLYLETSHFGIFQKDGRLFSNGARLRIEKTKDNLHSLTYVRKPLEPYQDAEELSAPAKGTTRRSFVDHAFSSIFT